MIRPSTLTTAEASMSGLLTCMSFKRATICSVRDRAIFGVLLFLYKAFVVASYTGLQYPC
jgi:hypothetical protein